MFDFNYLLWFGYLPKELAVLLVSLVPIAELRVSLPLALTVYRLPWWEAYLLCVLGNMIPVFFIIKFIGWISGFLSQKSVWLEKFFVWLFKRTRSKLTKDYEKYGLWALAIFVAVPLPATGAWTGALAAWLFGLEIKKALAAILAGVMLAGVIVSLITFGFKTIF